MPKKPLKKKAEKKEVPPIIINPDLDDKGTAVVESRAAKILGTIAHGIGYVAGAVVRNVVNDTGKALLTPKTEIIKTKKRKMKEEVLDEISKRKAILYGVKAGSETGLSDKKMLKRMKGIKSADKKLYGGAKVMAKEGKILNAILGLNELSTTKLASYVSKAADQRRTLKKVKHPDPQWLDATIKKGKRESGLERATKKLAQRHDYGYHNEEVIDELYGKGSIDTIGKHHAARSSKGKPNALHHAIQRNRAARLRDIHKGTGPLGKTTMKGRMQYAKQDREAAKSLKEVMSIFDNPNVRQAGLREAMGWKSMNPDRAKTMTPDEHLGKISQHTQLAKKYGKGSLMGQLHTRAAGRHIHYLMAKDKSVDAAHKALKALKEVSNYKDVSRETKDNRKSTNDYLEKRHDEIIKRHKQGHSTDKIAKDMKLHPAVVSASTGIMKEDIVNEVSKKLINRYIDKTTKQDGSGGRKLGKAYNLALAKKWGGSRKGVTAKVRATEETMLDEQSYKVMLGKKHIGHVWHNSGEWHSEHKHSGVSWATDNRKDATDIVKDHHRSWVAGKKKKIKEEAMLDEAKRGRPRKVQDAESNEHINMQLRKTISLRGQNHVTFGDGTKHNLSPTLAHKALHMHDTMRTSIEKGEFAKRLAHSHNSFMDAVAGKPAAAAGPKITLGAGFGAKHIKK